MKKSLHTILALVVAQLLSAQSPKQVVVEHFTNTRCSICASRNPGFYQTLAGYPQVIHIAFHPSAPYQNCYFSQQNKTENDGRTNYYNTYGSTPDFVLNGKLLPSANPAINTTTLDTALNQTAPIEVEATEELITPDSVLVRIVIRTTENISAINARLFAGVAEEPVLYNAPNGENIHHDVFRKAMTDVNGAPFQLPAFNDSTVATFTYKVQNGWNVNQLHTVAIVQRESDRYVLNADKSVRLSSPVGVQVVSKEAFTVYPNPFSGQLMVRISQLAENIWMEVMDMAGRKMYSGYLATDNQQLPTENWPKGVYFLKIGNMVKKLVKQ
jgi:hypothetical protein